MRNICSIFLILKTIPIFQVGGLHSEFEDTCFRDKQPLRDFKPKGHRFLALRNKVVLIFPRENPSALFGCFSPVEIELPVGKGPAGWKTEVLPSFDPFA